MAFFPELQYNAPKINTPFENALPIAQLQQAANQNKLAQMQFQKAEEERDKENRLAGIYEGAYVNGKLDHNKVIQGLAQNKLGANIPAYLKQQNEAEASGVDLSNKRLDGKKKQFEITQMQRERSAAELGSLINDPELSHDKVFASIERSFTSGDIDEQQARQMIDLARQKDPTQLKPFLNQILMSVMKPKEQADLGFKERDFGLKSANEPFRADGTPNSAYQNYAISKATAGATQNYGSPVAGVGPDGNPIFFQPSKGGGAPSIVPGIRPAPPKPVEPTGEEKTAAGYLGRMKAAEKLVGGLAGGEPTVGTSVAGAIPFVGDYAQRKLMNTKQQQYKQAADDWIRAKLRKESGAVIGDVEMKREYQTYFPQPGDEPETIKQKAMARRQAEEQMIQSAGRAAPNLTEAAFTKAETDYMAKRRAQGVPDQEIALELQQGAAKPKPVKAGGVKFLGFE